MNIHSLPFNVEDVVTIPAGTAYVQEGIMSVTTEHVQVSIVHIFHGYMDASDGEIVFHPPMFVGANKKNAASYELTNSILEANGKLGTPELSGVPNLSSIVQ